MKRRDFLKGLLGLTVAAPLAYIGLKSNPIPAERAIGVDVSPGTGSESVMFRGNRIEKIKNLDAAKGALAFDTYTGNLYCYDGKCWVRIGRGNG